MNRQILKWGLGLTLCLAFSIGYGDEIWVVTGHETVIKNLNNKQLENIFLRKSILNEDGMTWIPLNLNPENPIRQAFSQTLLHRSPDILESYWNEQYFHGITPPYVVASEEAMLRFVTGTPGAIGYILPCHLDKRVKVAFKLPTQFELKTYCKK